MADIKRISNKNTITNGTEETNLSLSDILLTQHVSGDNSDYQVTFAQAQAVPYGVCNSASGENKTVTFSNYPSDFTAQVGTKILVKFTNKNTLGSVSAGTYPTLTAGGVTKPILAKGKTVASGVPFANQIAELTLTPDGWNIDQDAREVTTSYQINADGTNSYNVSQVNGALADYQKLFDSTITDANLAYPSKSGSGLYLCSSNAELVTGYYSMIFSNVVYSGTDYLVKQIAVPYGFGLLNGETWIRNIAYRKGTKTVGNWIKQVTESSLTSTLANYITTNYSDTTTLKANETRTINLSTWSGGVYLITNTFLNTTSRNIGFLLISSYNKSYVEITKNAIDCVYNGTADTLTITNNTSYNFVLETKAHKLSTW